MHKDDFKVLRLRLRIIRSAKKAGIKPTARLFGISSNTVRKWIRRFDGRISSLTNRSRAPKLISRKITSKDEKLILLCKKNYPKWGAMRLKNNFRLPYALKTIHHVFRRHNLIRTWRKKSADT